jgi:hypothetical protein
VTRLTVSLSQYRTNCSDSFDMRGFSESYSRNVEQTTNSLFVPISLYFTRNATRKSWQHPSGHVSYKDTSRRSVCSSCLVQSISWNIRAPNIVLAIQRFLYQCHVYSFDAYCSSKNSRSSTAVLQVGFNPLNAELNSICHLLILLGDLTFIVKCIISISNKMQCYKFYLYLETALHVSGSTSTHHQERIQLYLQHLVFVTPLLPSAAIVEELEPV